MLSLALVTVLLTAAVLSVDASDPPPLVLFVGRLHPAVVHFPIGALILAAILEGAGLIPRLRDLRIAVPFVLLVGAMGALVAVVAGYFLSLDGGYDATLVSRHQWLGIAVFALASGGFALALAVRSWNWWGLVHMYRALVMATAGLVLVTGHYGGTLTHGPGYLTQSLPGFLRSVPGVSAWIGDDTRAARDAELIADIDAAVVFQDLVLPIFERRCVQCHGPAKVKGNLRLDSPEGVQKGSRDGPVLVAGHPGQSEIVRRIVLSPSHEEAMPPDDETPLSVGETEIIRWWIAGGASFDMTVADMPDGPTSVDTYLNRRAAPSQPKETGIFALEIPEADEAAVAAAERVGFTVRPLAPDAPFLAVGALPIRDELSEKNLAVLAPIRRQIAALDLSRSQVGRLGAVGRMPHLTVLHLQGTRVADRDLAQLSRLRYLESLNLHGTVVSDAGLKSLAALKNLRRVYLWETKVTEKGVKQLKAMLPQIEINVGSGFSEKPTEVSP